MKFKNCDEKTVNRLFELISSLENAGDVRVLLSDLCTEHEIEQMAQRIRAAELLLEGKTYASVKENCDISSATLSRVSRCVQYGEGYRKFLK